MRPSTALDPKAGQEVAVINYEEILDYDNDDWIIFIQLTCISPPWHGTYLLTFNPIKAD
jgi:hypothetical protein